MGSYLGSFLVQENDAISKHTHPSQPNWITIHAVASELSIAETERLWLRFQQMGCNKDGEITEAIAQSSPIQNDAFARNILKKLMLPKTKKITFENYLRGLKWCETAELEEKVRAIFRLLLSSGQTLPKTTFVKILDKVYSNPDDRKDLDRVADILYTKMGVDKKGNLTEDQFVKGILTTVPHEMLEAILGFEVLPIYLKERLHRNLPEFSSTVPTPTGGIPTDSQLKHIAEKIHKKDWERIANKLGLVSDDIQEIRTGTPTLLNQTYKMLMTWKQREGSQAYSRVLEKALRDSGMKEAAQILDI